MRHLILRKFNTGHTSVIPTDTVAFEVVRGSTIDLREDKRFQRSDICDKELSPIGLNFRFSLAVLWTRD